MNILNRIKLKVSRGEYELSRHCILDKLPEYNFTVTDILNADSFDCGGRRCFLVVVRRG